MEIDSQKYFSSGKFAKLCGIGKQTLYHYDEIGIFSPEITDENNYRYYSYQQLEVFGAISMLKDIGMSLKEIKNYLDKRSPDELILLLENERLAVQKRLDKLNKIQLLINKKIETMKDYLENNNDALRIENLDEEHYITTCVLDSSSDKKIYEAFSLHYSYCLSKNISSSNFVGSVLNFDNVVNKNYSAYSYIYTKLYGDDVRFSNYKKESGSYIVAYHKGSYYDIYITYNKILEFICNNKISIDSNFYEDVILDDLAVKGYDNYVIKISIKIKE